MRREYWIECARPKYAGRDVSDHAVWVEEVYYRCHWCREESAARLSYCTNCGARMDAPEPGGVNANA